MENFIAPVSNDTLQTRLARQFAREMTARLGRNVMAHIVALNDGETRPNVCHSHDKCDANVFMDRAWLTVVGREFDLRDDDNMRLFEAADGGKGRLAGVARRVTGAARIYANTNTKRKRAKRAIQLHKS